MFHRVKSEAQPSEDAQVEKPVSQSAEVKEFKRPEQQQEDETISTDIELETSEPEDAAPEVDVEEPQTEKIEKEAVDMNQPSQDNQTQDKSGAQDAPAQTYQLANVAPSRGYPGAYPGYSAGAPRADSESENENLGDRRLTIGAGITMSGEIESCDYLLVEGTVEAALKGASVLDIAETGVFYGTVEIDDATIAGRFEGDITAHGRLILREGATVTGTIAYKELEIEAGAIIDGKLTPLQAVSAASAQKPSAAKKDAPAKTAGKDAQAQTPKKPEPANTDGGLFTKTAAAAE